MTLDTATVQHWLDAYSHAWITYATDEISALFSEDAEYRWHPWDEGDAVARGRDRIVAAWLENRDRPGTYRGEYHPTLISDDTAVAEGLSYYYTDDTQTTLERVYYNLWILKFTPDGQCSSFTEWYMKQPSATS